MTCASKRPPGPPPDLFELACGHTLDAYTRLSGSTVDALQPAAPPVFGLKYPRMAYASAGKDKCQVIVDVFVFLLATAPPIKARRLLHFAVYFSCTPRIN